MRARPDKFPNADFSEGSETTVTNCHSYSMGKDIWVNDPGYLFADDYSVTTNYAAGNVVRLQENGLEMHSIGINLTCGQEGNPPNIRRTKEKWRESRIYGEDYNCPSGDTTSLPMYKKK